jgi:hypothetical protein
MKLFVAALAFSIGLGVGAVNAADGCGPGCHAAINGGCVVNGWQTGAAVRNECPAGAQPRPPCGSYYSWRRHSKTCMRLD